jgi:hypothetical protein
MDKEQPLILVIYMDRMVFADEESFIIIQDNLKDALDAKGVNAVTLFVATETQERIECINPVIATDEQNNRINAIINDIEKSFDVGHDLTDDYEGSAVSPFKDDES